MATTSKGRIGNILEKYGVSEDQLVIDEKRYLMKHLSEDENSFMRTAVKELNQEAMTKTSKWYIDIVCNTGSYH
ncbi:hypothetical protein CCR75_005787 [Bremia lactucae]|uniref:Uncharacterized protein n=1 Tax=Bremia lactucae TaxID=4779 RepID=A0A976FGN5_BRELC|nr:hypothetical protein CCR75_005787 [Bremia lactucae]